MTLCPQKCPKCNNWMNFEIKYYAGSPETKWYCPVCDLNLNEYYSIAVSDHTIIDKENAFVEEIHKSDMTDSIEILNWYRNLYYTEGLNTERGIVAMAINDLFMKYKDALR